MDDQPSPGTLQLESFPYGLQDGGTEFSSLCPPHHAVTEIKPRIGERMNALTVGCRHLLTGNYTGLPRVGNDGGNEYTGMKCSNNQGANELGFATSAHFWGVNFQYDNSDVMWSPILVCSDSKAATRKQQTYFMPSVPSDTDPNSVSHYAPTRRILSSQVRGGDTSVNRYSGTHNIDCGFPGYMQGFVGRQNGEIRELKARCINPDDYPVSEYTTVRKFSTTADPDQSARVTMTDAEAHALRGARVATCVTARRVPSNEKIAQKFNGLSAILITVQAFEREEYLDVLLSKEDLDYQGNLVTDHRLLWAVCNDATITSFEQIVQKNLVFKLVDVGGVMASNLQIAEDQHKPATSTFPQDLWKAGYAANKTVISGSNQYIEGKHRFLAHKYVLYTKDGHVLKKTGEKATVVFEPPGYDAVFTIFDANPSSKLCGALSATYTPEQLRNDVLEYCSDVKGHPEREEHCASICSNSRFSGDIICVGATEEACINAIKDGKHKSEFALANPNMGYSSILEVGQKPLSSVGEKCGCYITQHDPDWVSDFRQRASEFTSMAPVNCIFPGCKGNPSAFRTDALQQDLDACPTSIQNCTISFEGDRLKIVDGKIECNQSVSSGTFDGSLDGIRSAFLNVFSTNGEEPSTEDYLIVGGIALGTTLVVSMLLRGR